MAHLPSDQPAEIPPLDDLSRYRISSLPSTSFYIPSFILPSTESILLQRITTAPKPAWTQLSHRSLQTYPSRLTGTNTLLAAPLPDWLVNPIIPRMKEAGIWKGAPHEAPNHVLVNIYEPGQGIMPHQDGGAYWPAVGTVSLGAPIVLEVFAKTEDGRKGRLVGRILQEARSLLITTDELYTDYLHGIAELTNDEDLNGETISNWHLLGSRKDFAAGRYDRQTRISLTYRDVLKVSNIGSSLKFLGKR